MSPQRFISEIYRVDLRLKLRILGHSALLINLAFLGSLVPRLLQHFRFFDLSLFSAEISSFCFQSKNRDFTEITGFLKYLCPRLSEFLNFSDFPDSGGDNFFIFSLILAVSCLRPVQVKKFPVFEKILGFILIFRFTKLSCF